MTPRVENKQPNPTSLSKKLSLRLACWEMYFLLALTRLNDNAGGNYVSHNSPRGRGYTRWSPRAVRPCCCSDKRGDRSDTQRCYTRMALRTERCRFIPTSTPNFQRKCRVLSVLCFLLNTTTSLPAYGGKSVQLS